MCIKRKNSCLLYYHCATSKQFFFVDQAITYSYTFHLVLSAILGYIISLLSQFLQILCRNIFCNRIFCCTFLSTTYNVNSLEKKPPSASTKFLFIFVLCIKNLKCQFKEFNKKYGNNKSYAILKYHFHKKYT